MPKLRKTIISRIYEALEGSDFSLRDFDVDFEDTDGFVRIQFNPYPAYMFEIVERDVAKRKIAAMLEPHEPDNQLFTVEAPGEYKTQTPYRHRSIDDCIARIPTWCKNINDELSAPMPEPDIIKEFEAEIEKEIASQAGDSTDRFSKVEIDELQRKLDSISEKFSSLEKESKITSDELARVKYEIEKLRSKVAVYPKSTWYKVSGHKMLDFLKSVAKSKEGRDLILSSAKKLLGLE